MGMTAARHARSVVANAEIVIALEALAAAQALDLRSPLRPAAATAAVRDRIRRDVAFLEADRELGPDIALLTRLVREGVLLDAAQTAAGELS
jgi:histidine ammonia-lyase